MVSAYRDLSCIKMFVLCIRGEVRVRVIVWYFLRATHFKKKETKRRTGDGRGGSKE